MASARAQHRGETVALGFQGIGLQAGHKLGTLAELAVAKLLCIYPLIGIDDRRDIPDHDLMLHNGQTLEVKYRAGGGGEFALNNDRPTSWKTDYGVLVWPGPDDMSLDIVGFMTREDFATHAYTGNLGRGLRLIYPTAMLRPIQGLMSVAYNRQGVVYA